MADGVADEQILSVFEESLLYLTRRVEDWLRFPAGGNASTRLVLKYLILAITGRSHCVLVFLLRSQTAIILVMYTFTLHLATMLDRERRRQQHLWRVGSIRSRTLGLTLLQLNQLCPPFLHYLGRFANSLHRRIRQIYFSSMMLMLLLLLHLFWHRIMSFEAWRRWNWLHIKHVPLGRFCFLLIEIERGRLLLFIAIWNDVEWETSTNAYLFCVHYSRLIIHKNDFWSVGRAGIVKHILIGCCPMWSLTSTYLQVWARKL